MTKRIEFKTANSIGHFNIPDDATLTIPDGIQVYAEDIEPLRLNTDDAEAEKAAKDVTHENLADYEEDPLLLLPTEMALRNERKVADETSNDEIEPLLPNMQ